MKRTTTSAALAGLVLGSALTLLPASPASAAIAQPITGRASTLPGSVEPGAKGDSADAAVSGNGRYVVFSSLSRLVPADTDPVKDVYLKDLLTDRVERINVTTDGKQANNSSRAGAVTPDGRFVVFWSWATNLVAGDSGVHADVFVRDRQKGTTERVSVTSGEVQGNGASPSSQSDSLDISSDGRFVVFGSTASNLGADADTVGDIFVRDRSAGTTELISVSSAEVSSDSTSYNPTISADGRYVAFESDAANLVGADSNAGRDIFVRDRSAGTTERVSLHDNDAQAGGQSFQPTIADSGTKVVFASNAKLNGIDNNSTTDVYVRDRSNGTTTVGSVGTDGWAAGLSTDPAISGDGATVAYQSTSPMALAGANGWEHIYTRKVTTTQRASVTSTGTVVGGTSSNPSLSTDGKVVAYDSKSNALVSSDSGGADVFFRRTVGFGPFNSTGAFVQQQLQDFTGAVPSAEVTKRNKAILDGASPERMLTDLAYAPTFAGKQPQVIRLYAAYFGRLPDRNGLAYWVGKVNGGAKLDSVSAKFAASSEFKTKYGNTTNAEFVKLVYQNVMNRQPDAAGLNFWVNKLNGGMSRGTVMTNFSESSEGQRKFQPQVTATLLGLGMLRTIPTNGLLQDLLFLASSDSPEAAARNLLDSPQYATRIA